MRRGPLVMFVLVALVLAATACAVGGGGRAPEKATFSANLGEPSGLIPGNTNESEGAAIDELLFAGLTSYDPKTGEATNLVAKSIKTPDQQHWTIKLKEGWTFHNGEPVTARSFVGAWNATVYNAWDNAYFFTDVLSIGGAGEVAKQQARRMSGLSTPDDHTIKITLTSPNSDLPLVLGYTGFYPMPESVLKSKDWDRFNEKPIGNGKYEMAGRWKHNRTITLTRYAGYAGPQPGKADEIHFKIYTSPAAAYNDVIAGDLDLTDTIPTSRLGTAPKRFGDRYVKAPSSEFTYLGFPLWLERYQDVRVRQAFSMAIDRKKIAKEVFAGTVTPADSIVSPMVKLGHRDDPCEESCEFNPKTAKKLLTQAGFDTSKPVTLWYNTGAGNKAWVRAVARMLHRNLGVRVTLRGQPWAQYLETVDDHEVTGPYRLGWTMDYPSPADYIGPLWSTGGSSNGSGYSNPVVDRAVEKGRAADSPRAAVRYYHKAEDAVLDDLPMIPMYFDTSQAVHSTDITHVTFDAQGHVRYDRVEVKR